MDLNQTTEWFQTIVDAEYRLTKKGAEAGDMGNLMPLVEDEIRSRFIGETDVDGKFIPFRFRLDPPEQMTFAAKILRTLAQRVIIQAELWSSPTMGTVTRFLVSDNKLKYTNRLTLAFDAAEVGGALKVVALSNICGRCMATGMDGSEPCSRCEKGVKFEAGLQFELSERTKKNRLAPLTTDEISRMAKAGSVADLESVLDNAELLNSAAVGAAKAGNAPLLRWIAPKAEASTLHLSLKASARVGQPESVKILLEAGAPPNGIEEDGAPLEAVCQHAKPDDAAACTEVLGLLLTAGADPNLSRGGNGNTCLLHLAYAGWSVDAMRLLVEAGADLKAVDNRKRDALELALAPFDGRDKTSIVEYVQHIFEK
jgi:hypothetical protein